MTEQNYTLIEYEKARSST